MKIRIRRTPGIPLCISANGFGVFEVTLQERPNDTEHAPAFRICGASLDVHASSSPPVLLSEDFPTAVAALDAWAFGFTTRSDSECADAIITKLIKLGYAESIM